MATATRWPDGRVMIPDLLQAAPRARPVLDQYGLRGCGGPRGPHESLAFFAQAHDVPLDQLLREIQESLERPAPSPAAEVAPASDLLADTIYRPFFKAGIAVVLTLGAAWGAYLLLRIALLGSFHAAGIQEVNAHGHAQIFGWVGLFVMGFAYQAFPRFKHASLPYPRLAHASFWLLLAGLVVRSLGQPLVASVPWLWWPVVIASVLEIVAIVVCAWIVIALWRTCGKPLAVYDGYILCALAWFVIQAVYESLYLAATLSATGDALLPLVATWQAPLRDIQIHGFALLMILGVSQRLFPAFYGFRAPSARLAAVLLPVLNLAVIGEATGLILMRVAGHAWAGLWCASVVVLAATAMVLVRNWGIFAPSPEPDRSLKFLRAAYVWLFVSLGMLAALPAYQFALLPLVAPESGAAQIGFSHAYYGAVRHAITVGFVSLMIVGVAAKVVPTLNGVDIRGLTGLWATFVLLNAGCALRVIAQTLTDVTPDAFPVTGVSGLLEVLGLALWGGHLLAVMAGQVRLRSVAMLAAGGPIEATHRVGDVLDRHPERIDVFLRFGFRPLTNPLLRRTIARQTTIATACRTLGVNQEELLAALNEQRRLPGNARFPLPVLSNG